MAFGTKQELSPFAAWGFELGDWFSFYSSEPATGANFQIHDQLTELRSNHRTTSYVIGLRKGIYHVNTSDKVYDDRIQRSCTLIALTNSMLGDFVLRMGVLSQDFNLGRIAGQELSHLSENVYHEYQVNDAQLIHEQRQLSIQSSSESFGPSDGFTLVTYIRDEPPQTWILHHRLLSSSMDYIVWSIYKWRFSLPRLVQRIGSPVSNMLLRRRERTGSKSPLPTQTGSLTKVGKGIKLTITAEIGIRPYE